jgi:hypothetical protein
MITADELFWICAASGSVACLLGVWADYRVWRANRPSARLVAALWSKGAIQ